jgi:tetratricopeptide (TPR) repeat protein
MNGKVDRMRVIEAAEKFVKSGKIKEAIAEYEKLLGGESQDFAISNIIGDLCVRLGQNEKGVRSFLDVAEEYERRGLYSQALAVFKKVAKIKPDTPELSVKLADLYSLQGFSAEARKEYLKTADEFQKSNKPADAIRIFEKIVKLDRDDLESRLKLAALYQGQGFKDAAAEQLDDIAEADVARNDLEGAEKRFLEAKSYSPGHARTLLGLIEVYKKTGRKKEAMEVVEAALKEDVENPQLLNLVGNSAFDDGDFAKAEEAFTLILNTHPMNVNARIKLGRIQIRKENLDRAFELYEPLINSLIKKQKEEKAVGLLGLILATQKTHLPSLDKLAAIYRSTKDLAKLEVVDRVILDELRKQKLMDRALATISELAKIRPDDIDIQKDYRHFRREMGLPEEEEEETGGWTITDKDREIIQKTLDQADLYIQQGLVRNARRIIENLRMKYSDDPQIMQKISVLDEIRSQMSEEEIRLRVEKAQAMESQAREGDSRAAKVAEARETARKKDAKVTPSPFPGPIIDDEKISTADIFAETDIIPLINLDGGERTYYDLKLRLTEEARMLQAIADEQSQGATTQLEKELSVIVSDFRKGLKQKFQPGDFDIHYQLGIAFMEQGLISEAIEELTMASKDKSKALECYNIISQCYRSKKNFPEAERWLNKAILMTKEGTEPYFALIYDRALLSEEAQETDKALSLYKEIQTWNPAYRGISEKVSYLEKQPVA